MLKNFGYLLDKLFLQFFLRVFWNCVWKYRGGQFRSRVLLAIPFYVGFVLLVKKENGKNPCRRYCGLGYVLSMIVPMMTAGLIYMKLLFYVHVCLCLFSQ